MTAPAVGAPGPSQATTPTAPPTHTAKHLAAGIGIGGATVAAGFLASRHFTVGAGHVKKLSEAGKLVIDGPKVHGAADPRVHSIAHSSPHTHEVLRNLVHDPKAMTALHADLRSPTPSKAALKISNHMHPNGNTNPQIAHSRGKKNFDLLHDALGESHRDARVAATKAMIEHSNPADTHELHRGMRGVEHQVGDVIDFGHMSSFTSTHPIAEAYAKQKKGARGVYSIGAGKAKAMPLDGTGWTSRNHEWLVGGKYKVAGKRTTLHNGEPMHHYDLEPHTDDVAKKWTHGQKNTSSYHWFRDGMHVGQKFASADNATRAKWQKGADTLASNIKPNHARAFKTGLVLTNYGTRPSTIAAASAVAAGTAAYKVAHHRQADKQFAQKEATMAKSAFDIDHEISKLGPPKVHYREVRAYRHKDKDNSTKIFGPDEVNTEYKGKSLILRRDKYEASGKPSTWKARHNDVVSVSPRYRVHHSDARKIADAYQKDSPTVTLSSGVTMKHKKVVHKSAFGVEHEDIEKGVIGEALKMGEDAVKGLRSGFGVANSTPVSAAGKLGSRTGTSIMGAAKKVNTPKRALAVGAGGGLFAGAALGHNNGN